MSELSDSTVMAPQWPESFPEIADKSPSSRSLSRHPVEASWRLTPSTVGEVAQILQVARERRSAVYPVSCGRNWGYGSHLPNRSGGIILDLSRFKNISEFDPETSTIRIEPGVTQSELYRYLLQHAPGLVLNVTGSGEDTSVLGNALERGLGYSGEKEHDIYALEAFLADGSYIKPAPGRNHAGRREPAGFQTDALFMQTNFGVVMGGRLRLRTKQECEMVVIAFGDFESLLPFCRKAYAVSLVTSPTHISEPGRSRRLGEGLLRRLWGRKPNDEEVEQIFPERSVATALLPIFGQRSVVKAIYRSLADLKPDGISLQQVTESRVNFAIRWLPRVGAGKAATRLKALLPLFELPWGKPSNAGLASLDQYAGGDPDIAEAGALYGNAVCSGLQYDVYKIQKTVRSLWQDCAFTWTLLDQRCLTVIYTLHFRSERSSEAHLAYKKIIARLREQGFPQYRLDISTKPAPGAEMIVAKLKRTLDPCNILAPGRYDYT